MYPYHPQGYPPGPPPPRWGPPQGAPPPAWHLHPPGMAVPPPNVPPPPGTALPPPVYAPPPTSYYGSYPPPPDPAVSAPTPAAVLTPVPAAVPADVPSNPPYPTVTVPQQQEQQMDTIRKANGEVPSFDEYLDFKKLLSRKEWKHLFGRDPTFKEYIEFYDRKEAINWMAVCGTVPTFEDYMEFLVERDSRDWVAFCQVIPTFKDFIDHIQKNASFDFKAECGLKPRFKDFMMYYKVIKKSKDWASLYKRQVTYVDFLSFTKQAQDKEWHDISPLRGSPKFEDFLDYTLECESRNWEKEYGSAPTFTEFVQVRELNEPGNLERFQGLEPRLEHLMEFKEHKKSRDWHEFCERLPSLEDFLAYLSHQSSPHWMTLADKYNDKPFFTDYMKFLQIRASKDWQALRGADPTFANFIEYLCRRQARDWKAVLGHVPSFHDFIEYVDHSASDEWKALGDAMPSFLAFMGYKLGVRIKDATTAREERSELDSRDKRVYRSRSRSRSRKRTFSRSTSPYGKRPRHRSRERSDDRHGDRARHRRSRSRSREGRNRYRRSRSRGYSPYRSGSRRHSNERSGRHHSGSRRSRSRSRGGRRSPAEAYDPFAPSLSSPPRGGGGRRRSEHMYDDISNSSFPDDRRKKVTDRFIVEKNRKSSALPRSQTYSCVPVTKSFSSEIPQRLKETSAQVLTSIMDRRREEQLARSLKGVTMASVPRHKSPVKSSDSDRVPAAVISVANSITEPDKSQQTLPRYTNVSDVQLKMMDPNFDPSFMDQLVDSLKTKHSVRTSPVKAWAAGTWADNQPYMSASTKPVLSTRSSNDYHNHTTAEDMFSAPFATLTSLTSTVHSIPQAQTQTRQGVGTADTREGDTAERTTQSVSQPGCYQAMHTGMVLTQRSAIHSHQIQRESETQALSTSVTIQPDPTAIAQSVAPNEPTMTFAATVPGTAVVTSLGKNAKLATSKTNSVNTGQVHSPKPQYGSVADKIDHNNESTSGKSIEQNPAINHGNFNNQQSPSYLPSVKRPAQVPENEGRQIHHNQTHTVQENINKRDPQGHPTSTLPTSTLPTSTLPSLRDSLGENVDQDHEISLEFPTISRSIEFISNREATSELKTSTGSVVPTEFDHPALDVSLRQELARFATRSLFKPNQLIVTINQAPSAQINQPVVQEDVAQSSAAHHVPRENPETITTQQSQQQISPDQLVKSAVSKSRSRAVTPDRERRLSNRDSGNHFNSQPLPERRLHRSRSCVYHDSTRQKSPSPDAFHLADYTAVCENKSFSRGESPAKPLTRPGKGEDGSYEERSSHNRTIVTSSIHISAPEQQRFSRGSDGDCREMASTSKAKRRSPSSSESDESESDSDSENGSIKIINSSDQLLKVLRKSQVGGFDVLDEDDQSDDARCLCPICEKWNDAWDKVALSEHIQGKHQMISSFYRCFVCCHDDIKMSQIKKHLNKRHSIVLLRVLVKLLFVTVRPFRGSIPQCKHCDYQSHSQTHRREHQCRKASNISSVSWQDPGCKHWAKHHVVIKSRAIALKHIQASDIPGFLQHDTEQYAKPDDRLRCCYCVDSNKCYGRYWDYNYHLKSGHGMQCLVYRCFLCGHEETTLKPIRQHLQHSHNVSVKKTLVDMLGVVVEPFSADHDFLRCDNCGITCARNRSMRMHDCGRNGLPLSKVALRRRPMKSEPEESEVKREKKIESSKTGVESLSVDSNKVSKTASPHLSQQYKLQLSQASLEDATSSTKASEKRKRPATRVSEEREPKAVRMPLKRKTVATETAEYPVQSTSRISGEREKHVPYVSAERQHVVHMSGERGARTDVLAEDRAKAIWQASAGCGSDSLDSSNAHMTASSEDRRLKVSRNRMPALSKFHDGATPNDKNPFLHEDRVPFSPADHNRLLSEKRRNAICEDRKVVVTGKEPTGIQNKSLSQNIVEKRVSRVSRSDMDAFIKSSPFQSHFDQNFVNRLELETNERTKAKASQTCPICKQRFSPKALLMHTHEKHGLYVSVYRCYLCGQDTYPRRGEMERHLRDHDVDADSTAIAMLQMLVNPYARIPVCEQCGFRTTDDEIMFEHTCHT